MYNVFYVQELKDGTSSRQMVTFETRELAMSRYHSELAQIGISDVLNSVTAMVFTDSCSIIAHSKEQLMAPEPEPTEE